MKRNVKAGLGAVAAIAVLAFVSQAHAFNSYLNSFHTAYPSAVGTRIDNCNLCHLSGGYNRNAYGAAYATANYSFTAIGAAPMILRS